MVDVTQQSESSDSDFPTVVTIKNDKHSRFSTPFSCVAVVLNSPASAPNTIQESVFSSSLPTPSTHTSIHSQTVLVLKNKVYYEQPLRTIGSLQSFDKAVNLCGVLVKVMDVRRCSTGDFSRIIYLIDETSSTPFQITVFFKEEEQGSIFTVHALSPRLIASAWGPPFSCPRSASPCTTTP